MARPTGITTLRTTIRTAAALAAAVALPALTGCEIEEPALPTFSTRIAVPLGLHEFTVAELVEDQENFHALADSVLGFSLEGDTTALDLDLDLSADIAGEEVETVLGVIELPAAPPLDFGFTLEEIFPGAGSLPPGPVPVPAFDFDLESDPADLADITSAHVQSGGLRVTVRNDLPIPVSGDAPPALLTLGLLDPADGSVLASADFDGAIAPGDSAVALMDLADVWLPDAVAVHLLGGSEGGFAADGLSPDDGLSITVELLSLVVDQAEAVIGEQTFTDGGELALPDDLGVIHAGLESGVLGLELSSDLPIPCTVTLGFPEIATADGQPVSLELDLPASSTASTRVDLAGGAIASPDGEPIAALGWTVDIVSAGSEGVPVTIAATDRIAAAILPTTLSLSEVTGVIPEEVYVLDPVSESLDLPDELEGLHLRAAAVTIDIVNGTGIAGDIDLALSGIDALGDTTTVTAVARIAADDTRGTRTTIVIDESNSDIEDLLSALPETFVFRGEVRIGGPDEIGTVRPGDSAEVTWRVDAPLQLAIDPTEFEQDPEPLDLDADTRDALDEHLVQAELLAEIANGLPVGVQVSLLVGADEATTLSDPTLTIGPLDVTAGVVDPVYRWVTEPGVSTHEIALSAAQVSAITAPGAHMAVVAALPGTDGEDVIVRICDGVGVRGALSAEVLVSDDE